MYICVSTVIYKGWYQPKVGISATIKTQPKQAGKYRNIKAHTGISRRTKLTGQSKHPGNLREETTQILNSFSEVGDHPTHEWFALNFGMRLAKGEGLILVVAPPVFCPLVMFNYHVCGMRPVPVACSISPLWIPKTFPFSKIDQGTSSTFMGVLQGWLSSCWVISHQMLPYQPGGSALLTARENIRRPPLPSCSTWRLKHLILASDGHGWMIKKTQWYQMNRAHVFLLFVSRYNLEKGAKWLIEWFKLAAHLFQEWFCYNMFKAEGRYIGAQLPWTTFLL